MSKSGLTRGVIRGSVFRIIVSEIYYVFSVGPQTVLSTNSFVQLPYEIGSTTARPCFSNGETKTELMGNLPKDHTLNSWQSRDANLES